MPTLSSDLPFFYFRGRSLDKVGKKKQKREKKVIRVLIKYLIFLNARKPLAILLYIFLLLKKKEIMVNSGQLHGNGGLIFTGLFLVFIITLGKGYITKPYLTYRRILSLFLSGIGVIFVWRSIIGLADLYLFPWDIETSYWSGLIMGLSLIAIFVFDYKIH